MGFRNPDHDHVEKAKKYVKEQTRMGRNGKPMEGWSKDVPGESLENNVKRVEEFDRQYRIAKGQRKHMYHRNQRVALTILRLKWCVANGLLWKPSPRVVRAVILRLKQWRTMAKQIMLRIYRTI